MQKRRALTPQELQQRIKDYRRWIDNWKYAASLGVDGVEQDIRDLEAWINTLIGPRDFNVGIPRAKAARR